MIDNLLIRTHNIVFGVVGSDFEVDFEPTFILHKDGLGEVVFLGVAHEPNYIIGKSNIA